METNPTSSNANHQLDEDIQIIVFSLGSQKYALPIDQVRELVITPPITQVPLTPDYIIGVANVRGSILTIVDLEKRLSADTVHGLNGQSGLQKGYTVVVIKENLTIGVLVKEIPATMPVKSEQMELTPNLIQNQALDKNYLKGVIKHDNEVIIYIDIFALISPEDIQ